MRKEGGILAARCNQTRSKDASDTGRLEARRHAGARKMRRLASADLPCVSHKTPRVSAL